MRNDMTDSEEHYSEGAHATTAFCNASSIAISGNSFEAEVICTYLSGFQQFFVCIAELDIPNATLHIHTRFSCSSDGLLFYRVAE